MRRPPCRVCGPRPCSWCTNRTVVLVLVVTTAVLWVGAATAVDVCAHGSRISHGSDVADVAIPWCGDTARHTDWPAACPHRTPRRRGEKQASPCGARWGHAAGRVPCPARGATLGPGRCHCAGGVRRGERAACLVHTCGRGHRATPAPPSARTRCPVERGIAGARTARQRRDHRRRPPGRAWHHANKPPPGAWRVAAECVEAMAARHGVGAGRVAASRPSS